MKTLLFATIFSIAVLTQASFAFSAESQYICFSRANNSFFTNPSVLQKYIVSKCDVTKQVSFAITRNPNNDSYTGSAVICCWTPATQTN